MVSVIVGFTVRNMVMRPATAILAFLYGGVYRQDGVVHYEYNYRFIASLQPNRLQ